jgi:tetraacyldisaccharide 4'-kinase
MAAVPLKARLQSRLVDAWQTRGPLARTLYPLSALHALWRKWARALRRIGLIRPRRVRTPVIVIGNLYVGGTGKTPLAIEIVRALKQRGWHPGVVSRGYKGRTATPQVVTPHGAVSEFGDEPVLIARATGAPVVVGRNRLAAAKLLLNLYPQVDVLLTDDGLQHLRLARDCEIAVVHYRGFGNGWLLPAGPLRDPPQRLDGVDAVVFHGETPVVRVYSPFFRMRTRIARTYALKDPTRQITLDDLAAEQRKSGTRLIAAAGIGMPDRFFSMLRDHGLSFTELALGDHFDFVRNPFEGRVYDCCLITEKDAVKCALNPALAADGRICVVPLETEIDPALIDLIEARARAAQPPPAAASAQRTAH